jgi:integrase
MPKRETVEKYPFLCRYKESKIYYLRTSIKGRLIEKSTGCDQLARALTVAKRLLSESGGDARSVGKILYNDLRDEVLLAQSNKSKATYDSAKYQFKKLDRFFKGLSAEQLTEQTWERYVAYSRSQEPNRQLEHDRRHYLMTAALAYKRGLLDHPVRIKKFETKESPGRCLTKDEADRLVSVAERTSKDLHLQVLMALTMGMRKSEILKLTWDRVGFDNGLIVLRAVDTKIRRGRTFAMSEVVSRLLVSRARPSGEAFVFPHRNTEGQPQNSLKTLWTEVRRLSGVKCRFHDLRHTFLTNAFKEAVNPALICNFAGLSLEEAQKTYLHISPEDTRVVLKNTWGNMGKEK